MRRNTWINGSWSNDHGKYHHGAEELAILRQMQTKMQIAQHRARGIIILGGELCNSSRYLCGLLLLGYVAVEV